MGVGRDEVELFGTISLKMGFARKFFELGSSAECVQGNRKVLFSLHDDFGKLEKDLEKSGIVIEFLEGGEDVEVPLLVHISHLENGFAEGSSDKASKKKKAKEDRVESGESGCKKKKKKKKWDLSVVSASLEGDNEDVANGESITNDGGLVFDVTVISNLQMQFERVATAVGMNIDGTVSSDSPERAIVCKVTKKRKRAKSIYGPVSVNDGGSAVGKSGEKSAKKVRFSMKNNLVWKPQSPFGNAYKQLVRFLKSAYVIGSVWLSKIKSVLKILSCSKPLDKKKRAEIRFSNLIFSKTACVNKLSQTGCESPLPPQSLRLPPLATPRGSALKKGIPAGPVIETPMSRKVKHRISPLKKACKGLKSVSPSVGHLKKLRAQSA